MRSEWAAAGWGSRSGFALASLYWLAMLVLFLFSLRFANGAGELLEITGFYFVPLLYAGLIRGGLVLVTPRRRFWSWWLLVIGALIGILVTIARIALSSAGLT
jgi:hypothetical protein